MSTKPTRTFADLKGQKAWIPEGDVIGQAILEEAGLVDAVAGPPIGAVALQWFTKARYFTEMAVLYTYGTIIMSQRAFNPISAADQAVVEEVMARVTKILDRRARQDNQDAREALAAQGMTFIPTTPELEQRWREVAEGATRRVPQKVTIDPKLLAEVNRLLAEYRASHP